MAEVADVSTFFEVSSTLVPFWCVGTRSDIMMSATAMSKNVASMLLCPVHSTITKMTESQQKENHEQKPASYSQSHWKHPPAQP